MIKVDCKVCDGRGFVLKNEEGYTIAVNCTACESERKKAIYLDKIKKLGLGENVLDKTLDSFIVTEKWQQEIKTKAQQFLDGGKLFFIGGQIGSGKTHICTAILNKFLEDGKNCSYMVWEDIATRLKQDAYSDIKSYEINFNELKNIEILYIDDFFKKEPSKTDIANAFQFINTRYINTELITIISTEKTIDELIDIDEAIASRIYEMANSGQFIISIDKDIKKNYRFKKI